MHSGHRQRLLSKVLNNCNMLEQHEVLEAILFYAIPRKNTNEIARVFSAPAEVLTSVKGVGPSTVAYLKLFASVIETYSTKKQNKIQIKNISTATEYVISYMEGKEAEEFIVFLLDGKDKIITQCKFSSENKRKVTINLPEINNALAIHKPTSILLAHNHPSGNCTPSKEDDDTTYKIYLMTKLNNVNLYDHVIVSGKNYFSYFSSGKLDNIKHTANLTNNL